MSAIPGAATAHRSSWSLPWVVAVMVLPIVGAGVAAWIELREPGESAMWIVAGTCFLGAPGIAGWAGLHSAASIAAIRAVALALSAVLFGIALATLPVRSQAGFYVGGGTMLTPLVIAAGVALGWDIGSAQALRRLRTGSVVVGFIVGGAVFAIVSVIAFYSAFIV